MPADTFQIQLCVLFLYKTGLRFIYGVYMLLARSCLTNQFVAFFRKEKQKLILFMYIFNHRHIHIQSKQKIVAMWFNRLFSISEISCTKSGIYQLFPISFMGLSFLFCDLPILNVQGIRLIWLYNCLFSVWRMQLIKSVWRGSVSMHQPNQLYLWHFFICVYVQIRGFASYTTRCIPSISI